MDILDKEAVRCVEGYLKSNLWYLIWKIQGGRCFRCAMPIKLNHACKIANSFNVICPDCYLEPEITAMWFDEAAPIPEEFWEKLSTYKTPGRWIKFLHPPEGQ